MRRPEGQTNECKLRESGILATQTHGLKQLQSILQLEISCVPRISRSSVVGFPPPTPGESRNLGFCYSSPILETFAAKFWKFHVLPLDANKDQACLASSWDVLFALIEDPFANPHACVSGGVACRRDP